MAGFRNLRTKRDYDAREVVSALQKELRRSNVEASLYWAIELHQSGYDDWLWKRLRVIDVEDVSPLAGTHAELEALFTRAAEFKRKKADPALNRICAVQATILLALAPKNRIADLVLYTYGSDHMPRRDIPDYALDEHTLRGKRMGRGLEHFHSEAAMLIQPTRALADEPYTVPTEYLTALEARLKTFRLMLADPEQVKDLPENPWKTEEAVHDGEPAAPGVGSRTLPGPQATTKGT